MEKMQLNRLGALFLSIMAMVCAASPTQPETYDFFYHVKTYGTEVSSIRKDPETGIVWLATSRGLLRYGDAPFSQSVDVVAEDISTPLRTVAFLSDNLILVRTKAMSYKIYDPASHKVVVENLFDLYPDWGIICDDPNNSEVYVDGDLMWIRSGERLYSHAQTSDGKAKLRLTADSDILSVYPDGNDIYVLTCGELMKYDKRTFKVKRRLKWTHPVDTRNLRMMTDGKGHVWIYSKNLYRCDLKRSECVEVASDLPATDMCVSVNGNVYVSTNTKGIMVYDVEEDSLRAIMSNPYNSDGLLYNRLKSIFIDDVGNLWVSYSKQGMSVSNSMLSNNMVRHIPPLHENNIKDDIISVAYDDRGHLWLGTDGYGLYCDEDSFQHNRLPYAFTSKGEADNPVTSVFFDSVGNMWAGIYHKGLLMYSGKDWSVKLPNASPYGIAEDIHGNIYVATLVSGLYMLSPDNGYEPEAIDTGVFKYISQLYCDRGSNVYILFSSGLGILDAASGKLEFLTGNRKGNEKFRSTDLQTLLCDCRGLIWLYGADGHLDILDLENDKVINVDTPKGMPISSIIEGNDSSVWISSDIGIVNIAIEDDTEKNGYKLKTSFFRPRLNEDEFRHFNIHSAARSQDGTMVYGTTDGYMSVYPDLYVSSGKDTEHKVEIVALKVNNKIINPGDEYNGRVILDRDPAKVRQLRFKSDENNLSLTVHSRDYGSPFEVGYYYCVEGLSDSFLPILNNTIKLANLPVGSYKLKISCMNPDGSLSDTVSSLDIRVDAPWYLSIWALLFYVLILISIIVLTVYHFSERKNHRLRLEQADREMKRQYQINEMKLRFFTNISHDFRTPLTLIITPLEAYLNNNKGNPDVKFFKPIYRNAVRLLNLINQILDFRKLEVCGDTLNVSNGDIVKFVREICSSFMIFADDNDVRLDFKTNVNSLQMAFDRDKLSKILMNLLSNAFKHTTKEGIVTVRVDSLADSEVRVSVSDNGPGVPDSEKSRIFDRFYQNGLDNSANMGSGVGLHIVKEYVKLHEGDVTVTDNPGGGAVFTVTLPVGHVDSPESATPSKNAVRFEDQVDDQEITDGRQTILLVEDNAEFLDFLESSLEDEYEVLRASDGAVGLEVLGNNDVDIVISDVMMDNMDGLELCRRIKSDVNLSHIPVILLTAKSMIEDEIAGLETGADDYVTKPFSLSVLKARIQSILRARERYRKRFNEKIDVKPSEIAITPLDQQFLAKALALIEENISDASFSVVDLSDALGMHRANLYRKIHSLTGKSPIEFIRLIKLRRACQYLANSQMYVSEIAYAVGFNSPKLFAKYFKDEYGLSPREYKQNLNNGTHESDPQEE